MAKKTWKCTECEVEFSPPHWFCEDGRKHQVESKSYYSPAAELRTYVTEERVIPMGDGKPRLVPARAVQFARGEYSTCDPEDQFQLDVEPGLITAEQWQVRYIPEKERVAMQARNLAGRIVASDHLQKENETLLEQVKRLQAENAQLKEGGKPAEGAEAGGLPGDGNLVGAVKRQKQKVAQSA